MITNVLHTHRISNIILAEDNLDQCSVFEKALEESSPEIKLNVVNDGHSLTSLLFNFMPDLLFLDLNMPGKNGVECIKEIRELKAFSNLPIVVFTVSNQLHAIQAAYGLGANLYFIKPNTSSLLVQSLRQIFLMDWSDPRVITAKHFENNKYLPFEAA